MARIENELGKNERIVKKAEVRMALVIPYAVIGLVFCLLGKIGVLLGVSFTLLTYVAFSSLKLVLTDKRLLGKIGIIKITSMDAPLNKINMVSVERSFWARILGFGHLKITTASGTYDYQYIKNADEFRAAVMEAVDQYEENKLQKQAEHLAKVIKS